MSQQLNCFANFSHLQLEACKVLVLTKKNPPRNQIYFVRTLFKQESKFEYVVLTVIWMFILMFISAADLAVYRPLVSLPQAAIKHLELCDLAYVKMNLNYYPRIHNMKHMQVAGTSSWKVIYMISEDCIWQHLLVYNCEYTEFSHSKRC